MILALATICPFGAYTFYKGGDVLGCLLFGFLGVVSWMFIIQRLVAVVVEKIEGGDKE